MAPDLAVSVGPYRINGRPPKDCQTLSSLTQPDSRRRTLRFFYDQRNDVLTKDQVVEGILLMMQHPDVADFVIENLRKWKRWEHTGRVLELFGKGEHDVPMIRRKPPPLPGFRR